MDSYDDHARPFFTRVLDDLRAYDPRLFLRRNLSQGWWELWRWRDHWPIPSYPGPYSSSFLQERASLQFEVEEITPAFVRSLKMTDLARFDETLDPAQIAKTMDRMDKAKVEREEREIEVAAQDWAQDNKRGIRRDIAAAFSGYDPREP